MAVTFRDKDGTTRLAGDLLIGGTTGDVATVQADGTVGPAPGGSQPAVLYAKVAISSAQILASADTPIVLVAAPGANKIIVPFALVVYLHYGTAAYESESGYRVAVGDPLGSNWGLSFSNLRTLLTNTEDKVASIDLSYEVLDNAGPTAATDIVNEAFAAQSVPDNPTTGDGTLTAITAYTVLDCTP